jgi:hypothetical protein
MTEMNEKPEAVDNSSRIGDASETKVTSENSVPNNGTDEQSVPLTLDVEDYPEVEAPLLTEEHKYRFNALLEAENVALLSGFYDDIATGLICFYGRNDFGEITIHPIGLMLTPEMATKIKDDLGKPIPPH